MEIGTYWALPCFTSSCMSVPTKKQRCWNAVVGPSPLSGTTPLVRKCRNCTSAGGFGASSSALVRTRGVAQAVPTYTRAPGLMEETASSGVVSFFSRAGRKFVKTSPLDGLGAASLRVLIFNPIPDHVSEELQSLFFILVHHYGRQELHFLVLKHNGLHRHFLLSLRFCFSVAHRAPILIVPRPSFLSTRRLSLLNLL